MTIAGIPPSWCVAKKDTCHLLLFFGARKNSCSQILFSFQRPRTVERFPDFFFPGKSHGKISCLVVATQIFFGIFIPNFGEDEPIFWLIFFRWVETTNQSCLVWIDFLFARIHMRFWDQKTCFPVLIFRIVPVFSACNKSQEMLSWLMRLSMKKQLPSPGFCCATCRQVWFELIRLICHTIHGTGIFAHISHKNQPFM